MQQSCKDVVCGVIKQDKSEITIPSLNANVKQAFVERT